MLWNICHTVSALFGSVLLSNVCNSFCVVTFKRWVTLKKLCCFNNLKVFKSICHNFNTLFNRSRTVFCDVMVLIWRHVVQCSMCVTWLLKHQNYGIKRKKGEGKGINQWVCQFEGFKLFTMRFWDVSASLSSLRSWRIYQASVQMNS